jgi:hypothetical protein
VTTIGRFWGIAQGMDRQFSLIEGVANENFWQRHFEIQSAGLLDHEFSPQESKPMVHVLPRFEFVEKGK